MLVIGLTGGIGMGKSTAAEILKGFGMPVHNSDHVVHALLAKGGKAVKAIARIFPESLKGGAIDRATLGKLVFGEPDKLKKLEKILHPYVWKSEDDFLKRSKRDKLRAAVLEIPLLFETGAEKRCDVVICVSAPKAVQKLRVMKRKGMTKAKFKSIMARQMPDSEKRRRADYVVKTGVGKPDTKKQIHAVLKQLNALNSKHHA